MLKFIRTRLQGKAREVFVEDAALNQLITILRQKCCSKVNSDSLLAQIRATRQNGKPISNYMDTLCSKLAAAYVSEGLANTSETASKLAEKFTSEPIIQND